ncbi:MAG: hypothetical protein NTZ97_04045, partial [Candidatus Moranbacteria bacterium]|nr:hypothetical protein [Candidatus Moranbacteria bacterium]
KYNSSASCTLDPLDYTDYSDGILNQADATHNGQYICLYAEDATGNKNNLFSSNDINIDSSAPVLSSGSPSGTLSSVTTSTTLSLSTSETATCKYATTSGINYASMTAFTSTNATEHSSLITGLAAGTTYSYYFKCQDAALNESSESTLSFSIAPEENNISLNSIKIKIARATNKFKDKIYSLKNKFKLKGEDTNLANGTVKIYKNNKLWKTIIIDAQGAWSKILKFKDNFSGWLKIRQYDQYGTLMGTKKAKIKIDTEKPQFTQFITPYYSISKGQRLYWEATDNEKISQYTIYFNGHIQNNDEAYFDIPRDTKNGTFIIRVKASDRAGNSETKWTWVRVVD